MTPTPARIRENDEGRGDRSEQEREPCATRVSDRDSSRESCTGQSEPDRHGAEAVDQQPAEGRGPFARALAGRTL